MKKNKMMRLASALLVLTLLTAFAIGGTFAKYTTGASTSDTARVAHWGFTANDTITFNLFDATNETGIKSSNGDTVIAPGTTGSAKITVVNDDEATAPEVAYEINVSTNGSPSDIDHKLDEALTWTLQIGTNEAQQYDTWADLLAAIKKLSGDESGTKQYAAGTEVPDAFKNGTEYTISWTWDFERGTDAAGKDNANHDDTVLGSMNLSQLDELTLSIGVTISQLDTYTAPGA